MDLDDVRTGVVDEGVEFPILRFDMLERSVYRLVVFNVDLNGVKSALGAGKFLSQRVHCLIGFGKRTTTEEYIVLFVRATESTNDLVAKTSVGTCYEYNLFGRHSEVECRFKKHRWVD